MNFVEIVRGAFNVLLVMLVAGAVAYVGDRVGHQVGRKRLSLFGIRPRYTSTIIAIGTGMLIALVLTVGAILASHEVQTAFFTLSELNQQIATLQDRQQALEAKVNSGQLVVPVNVVLVPFYRIIARGTSEQERLSIMRGFYFEAVKFVNANYTRFGLRPYVIPPDVDKRLTEFDKDPVMAERLRESNVMLTITSDQNLYLNDQIHFGINLVSDTLSFSKGQFIAQLTIPGKSGANMALALSQLEQYVSRTAEQQHNLPQFLAENVQPLQLIPNVTQMQQMIDRPGNYVLTAYAAQDSYPHLGGIPIVIALAPGV